MLVYLALHPRGAGRDELLERFWPGRQAAAGRRNFHPTLSYVRRVLPARPESPILREGEFYRLNPDYPMTCDAWEFDAALDEARAARDPGARRAALARATTIATAPFLEGLYANWADALQARLRDRVEKALLELGELCARDGRFDAALEAFRRASELDEYRESTRLAVIECLVKLGARREAMVEYEKLKTLLRRELGVEPLPETEEGMQRLLRGDGVHGWPATPAPEMAQPAGRQSVARPAQARLKTRRGDSA
jgi:DNA-binding SARP family transcriptional activator